ncbi:MAG TPA: dUTP diphosphatase [Candidatus Fimenecus excrementavium]|jgi:dUTP pyrophosphatase|nr:dUTP diphosphatase [Candidatus Fimenecus excrementavium]
MEVLKIKKVQENAVIPKRATEGSAGLDLCACIDAPLTLNSGDTALIPTGLAIELPSSQYGAFVFARSGLSIKHGIGLLNAVGVIDSDYRGEIKVGVINQIKEPYTIEPGERIAQLVIMPVATLPVEEAQTLGESERGAGGFGSTGTK